MEHGKRRRRQAADGISWGRRAQQWSGGIIVATVGFFLAAMIAAT